jgi:hypothetical protein
MKRQGLLNPDKADLDNDGQLSSYEEARGKAIERNMKGMGGLLDDERERYAEGTLRNPTESYLDYYIQLDDSQRDKIFQEVMKDRTKRMQELTGNKTVGQILGGGMNLADRLMNALIGSDIDEIAVFRQSAEERKFNELAKKELNKSRESKVEGGTPERKEDKLTQESFMQMIADAATKQGLGPAEYKQQIGRRYAQEQLGEVSDETEEHIRQFAVGDIGQEDFFKYFIRDAKQEGGPMDNQMSMLIDQPKMTSDDEMEENYIDFIMDEALDDDEQDFLMNELRSNDRLSEVFDKVIEVASEFSGSGPVEGPGSGVSDSIPARLSDGEFVFTAKATEEIGESELMRMMKDAEARADGRQTMANGGNVEEEETVTMPVAEQAPQQDIRVTKETVGAQAGMQEQSDLVDEELKKSMLSTRPYVRS